MLFFANGEMDISKSLLVNIFFPSSWNDLKLSQFFLTCVGRFVGIFEYRIVILIFALPYGLKRQKRVQNWPAYIFTIH